ncbi:fibronectin type III domain-containing protein [Natrinema sp. CGMCC1.2065]|uniref:fibronectin type III domain-containing protein n=1 Tax=Natrinema sp. CGMCC1.2065 TaxID=3445767 RepID=UPI003F4A41A0
MAQYYTDFTDWADYDDLLTDWTPNFASEQDDWDLNTYSDYLEFAPAYDDNQRYSIIWESVGTASDVELLYKVQASSVNDIFDGYVRSEITNTSEVGYFVGISDNDLSITKYAESGDDFNMAETSFSVQTSTFYWIRFRVEGTDLKAKIWEDGNSEPGWMIQASDSTLTSGYVGVGSYNPIDQDFDVVSIGTNGDPAPMTKVPGEPRNVSATTDTDDQITVSWDEPSSGFIPEDYRVQIDRDGSGYQDPSGGPTLPSSTSAAYNPSSDSSYDSQVGIDSSFQFRVRAETSDSTSGWVSSGTVYTSPIPPHNPSVSRPDANTVEISWTEQGDLHYGTQIEYREDTGNGYSSWSYFDNSTSWGGSVSFSVSSNSKLQEDARYQFRLRSYNPNTEFSEWVYADYGNEGNVYFEDDFESGGFGNWDTTNLSDGDSGVLSGEEPVGDSGISGADEGTYYAHLESGDSVSKTLGDLSGESDVIVKCAMAAGSMDAGSESIGIDWYDGSAWQTLRHFGWEFNKQGWVEVSAMVPSSWLSTDNRVRLVGYGGSGDYAEFDRVVVSDILHEYTSPAAPSALSLDATTEGEITGSWTLNASLSDAPAHFQEWRQRRSGSGDSLSKTSIVETTSYTATGLLDGEQYDIRVDSLYQQFRRGSTDSWWRSSSALETVITVLPAPTTLTVDANTATSGSLSWTATHNYGDTRVEYRQSDANSWTTFSTVSRGTEAETITGLLHGEEYDVRVVAETEHTSTEDQ